jgi:hypothetical protein
MKENNIQEIITEIDSLTNLELAVDLSRLEEIMDRYFNHPRSAEFLDVWFRLYERCPDDESEGLFWAILHGLETYPISDRLVVNSVVRNPSEFPLMMVNRMLNAGIKKVDGVDLMELLQRVATNDSCSPQIRENADDFLVYHRNKMESIHAPPSEV